MRRTWLNHSKHGEDRILKAQMSEITNLYDPFNPESILSSIKLDEDQVRRLLVSSNNLQEIVQQGNRLLIPIYGHLNTFSPKVWDSQMTLLMVNERKPLKLGPKDNFFAQWDKLTKGMFKGIDWNNLFVAGGSVLGMR